VSGLKAWIRSGKLLIQNGSGEAADSQPESKPRPRKLPLPRAILPGAEIDQWFQYEAQFNNDQAAFLSSRGNGDPMSFFIGIADQPDRDALKDIIEAARALCSMEYQKCAELLNSAAMQIKQRDSMSEASR
jgi:hypothetical protein